MLTIYKASAGSGKTFQLVADYLKLLIDDPFNYRNILAVTFTNKATNEMKNRIMEQLYLLADNHNSVYVSLLQKGLSVTETTIRKRARKALKNILHDYNRFSVSTIDSFTQRIIKAFNREMGISPNFNLELDDELILDEAVDRLLTKIDDDKQLCRWLVKYSEEKIKENRSQQIGDDIKNLGGELFKEKFQLFFPINNQKTNVYTRERIEDFRKELEKLISTFKEELKNKARLCMKCIHDNGFSVDDFSYKTKGIAGYLQKISKGIIDEPKKRVSDAETYVDKWFSKTHKEKDRLSNLVVEKLQPALIEILSFYRKDEMYYFSAIEVRKQLRMMGILADLREEVSLLLQENDLLQLSGSNLLLSKIIGDTDSPFIYEKIGNKFNYFMLDEFQDTSSLQWNNFKPLIGNALAEGYPALIVGDVKQSIYRWRNSDWNILASQLKRDYHLFELNEITLDNNWRSLRNIIEFNNEIIEQLKNAFGNFLFSEVQDEKYIRIFEDVYQNFKQNPGKNKEYTGLAEVNFLSEEKFQDESLRLLIEQVKRLQDSGLKASDIAILIRKNSEGTEVIKSFLDAARQPDNEKYNLTVLSNESLFLFASKGVNVVMMVVALLIDPESKIDKTALLNLWSSWLKPKLKSNGFLQNNDSYLAIDFYDQLDVKNSNWNIEENFDEVFNNELGEIIKKLRHKVLLTSLDEIIIEICSLFGLFSIESELPFLQALIDKAADLKTNIANDLSNFQYWWNEKGYKTSVNVNEDVDSIRLLTVHKSKGLEFEAVLLPFFNWETSWSPKQAPMLWCNTDVEPFNNFPLLPVKASKNLGNTIFINDYLQEKTNSFIDILNLVYVAFTRAKSVLFVNCKQENSKKSSPKSINRLLHYSLMQLESKERFNDCWNEDKSMFKFGEMPRFKKNDSKKQTGWIDMYCYNDFSDRLNLKTESEDYFIVGKNSKSVKNIGKLVHEVLAEIITVDDIEPECKKAYIKGNINKEEYEIIRGKLTKSMGNNLIKNWFSDDYEVFNERSLLADTGVFRPDRIMIKDDKAIVVDYKWGEKMTGKYHKQVKKYADILMKCGYSSVIGFLWYINYDEVERIDL